MNSPRSNTVELSIFGNANDFLSEALHYVEEAEDDPSRWKFAIFNLTQAIELALKEALAREHQWLIYENVDKRRFTARWDTAKKRLVHLGLLDLTREDDEKLTFAFDKRNEIVHGKVSLEPTQVKPAFALLLGLISSLYRDLLNDDIRHHLPNDRYQRVIEISEYGSEIARRTRDLETDLDDRIVQCPKCGHESYVVDADFEAKCRVCTATQAEVWECIECEQLFVDEGEVVYIHAGFLCESCNV